MTDRARLMTQADRFQLRAGEPVANRATLTCRRCGEEWRVVVSVYVSEPSPCLRCWGGDWRPVGEIARDIGRRVTAQRQQRRQGGGDG